MADGLINSKLKCFIIDVKNLFYLFYFIYFAICDVQKPSKKAQIKERETETERKLKAVVSRFRHLSKQLVRDFSVVFSLRL